jgi:hypothetical protein
MEALGRAVRIPEGRLRDRATGAVCKLANLTVPKAMAALGVSKAKRAEPWGGTGASLDVTVKSDADANNRRKGTPIVKW